MQQSRIRVVCRKRPLGRREIAAKHQDVVACSNAAVFVKEPKLKVDLTRYVEEHSFQFDDAFGEEVTNDRLYNACVKPMVASMFEQKAKCTCFAYGQTGSGKTFTMLGEPSATPDDQNAGIFLLASKDIFSRLERNHEIRDVHVLVSFYEIYCGKLFDLLNDRRVLHARENSQQRVVIMGLREQRVASVGEMMGLVESGLASRTTGVTGANVDSSRSHAILQIVLKSPDSRSDENIGKLSFIDLAGSERGADTVEQDKQTRIDGAEINKSLLALKECIRALDQQLDHTPFRGSKLTQVLKDSFVGKNCQTLMIANLSPSSACVEHSLNTLRYAYRVKELRTQVIRGSFKDDDWLDENSEDKRKNEGPPSRSDKSDDDPLSALAKQHDLLIGRILGDEEALVAAHRGFVDFSVQSLQDEMHQLDSIDQPGSDVDAYVEFLDRVLKQKSAALASLKERLDAFKLQLKEEERISRKFHDAARKPPVAAKLKK